MYNVQCTVQYSKLPDLDPRDFLIFYKSIKLICSNRFWRNSCWEEKKFGCWTSNPHQNLNKKSKYCMSQYKLFRQSDGTKGLQNKYSNQKTDKNPRELILYSCSNVYNNYKSVNIKSWEFWQAVKKSKI